MRHLTILLILCAALLLPACAMDMSAAGDMPAENEGDVPVGLGTAEEALRQHDVEGAREIYAEMLDRRPTNGAAAAGLAVTDLLLVFGWEEVTELLVESLGAQRGIDANRMIYSKEGYLYWASKGVRWDDDGPYQGIGSLLSDEMPWAPERLESLEAFVVGLDEPADQVARKLAGFANALRGVDLNLETALEDPDFVRLFIPGQVFHDSELNLILGRSEVSALRVVIGLLRSALYFVAAYEHDWNLEHAFGAWRHNVEVTDPNYVPGFEPEDYTFDYLDRHLGRSIASHDRLAASRSALRTALSSGRDSIRFGLEEVSSTTMTWENVDEDDARELDEVLGALLDALDGPSEIPHTSPALTLDLSRFFEDGRVLSEEVPWFVQVQISAANDVDGNGADPDYRWVINEAAWEDFWLDDVVSPRPSGEPLLEILPGDDGIAPMVDAVLGDYLDTISEVFLTTR